MYRNDRHLLCWLLPPEVEMFVSRAALIAGAMSFASLGTVLAQEHPGVKVYAAQKCSICHSVAGVGNKKLPLDGVGTKLTDDQIREWLVTPAEAAKKVNSTIKPLMKAYASLPKPDLDALVGYLKSLEKK